MNHAWFRFEHSDVQFVMNWGNISMFQCNSISVLLVAIDITRVLTPLESVLAWRLYKMTMSFRLSLHCTAWCGTKELTSGILQQRTELNLLAFHHAEVITFSLVDARFGNVGSRAAKRGQLLRVLIWRYKFANQFKIVKYIMIITWHNIMIK